MNPWTQRSIECANRSDYLDRLFLVYPCTPDGDRPIDHTRWRCVEAAFNNNDNRELLQQLLQLELFPIKDSYVAYFKRDPLALQRNPGTVARLCARLRELGLQELYVRCTQPKETNRQIGPLFRRWMGTGALGAPVLTEPEFLADNRDAVLAGSDSQLMTFARQHLDYDGQKGLDIIARFNRRFVVGEAKFLTDFGGHQNAQFNDAKTLLQSSRVRAQKIAVLDGVLYIPSQNQMFRFLKENPHLNIMSALALPEFLRQI